MKWNGMVCKIRKLNGLEQYGMKWDGWDGFTKYGVRKWLEWFENSLEK